MSFCTNCGNPITTNAAFCVNCGVKLQTEQVPPQFNPVFPPIEMKPKKPRYAMAILLGSLMFVFCVMALLIFNVRQALSTDAIERMIFQIDIPNIRVGQMLNLEGEAYDRNITLRELVYTELRAVNGHLDNITMQTVENLMDALPIEAFLSTILTRYADGLLDGDADIRIYAHDLENFIRINEIIISRELGVVLSEEDFVILNEMLDEVNLTELTHLGTVADDIGINLSHVQRGLSPVLQNVFMLLALSMLVCILLLCNLSIHRVSMSLGIVFVCVGVVFGIVRIMIGVLITNIVPPIIEEALVNALVGGIQNPILTTMLGSLIIGVILITLPVVIELRSKRIQRSEII